MDCFRSRRSVYVLFVISAACYNELKLAFAWFNGRLATMDADKYRRSAILKCSTCGCDQFEYETDNCDIGSLQCADCGRVFAKDELIQENGENISHHVSEIRREVTKDFADEMRKTLKKALGNSKNFKIK